MKILKNLISKADDTLEEVEWYAEKALMYKTEHKGLADVYNKVADMHITIYDMLHKQMVELIEEKRRMGVTPPPEMMAIYEYEHEKLVEEFSHAKVMVDEYKKTY